MMLVSPHSLGSILLEYQLVSEPQLKEALDGQKARHTRLGETLVALGYLTEDTLTWCLANQLNIPCIPSIDTRPEVQDRAMLDRIGRELAWRYHVVPLLWGGEELTFATDDPLDPDLALLQQRLQVTLNVAVAPASEVHRALAELFGPDPRLDPMLEAVVESPPPLEAVSRFLESLPGEGARRAVLEVRDRIGRIYLRSPQRQENPELVEPRRLEAVLQGLMTLAGVDRIGTPERRRFSVGRFHGALTFAAHARGITVVVSLDEMEPIPALSAEGLQELRTRLTGPGLWVLGVPLACQWPPLVEGIVRALEPERRVVSVEPTWTGGPFADPRAFSAEILATLLELEPDVLVLPGYAGPTVVTWLRSGLPDAAIVLQVASGTPIWVLQAMRAMGMTGPELAVTVRGIGCLERPPAMRIGWCELSSDARAALAEDRPVSSLVGLLPFEPSTQAVF